MTSSDFRVSGWRPATVLLAALLLLAWAAGGVRAEEAAGSHQDVTNWLNAYGAAWESRDADSASTLFAPSARYHETPFESPFEGPEGVREYWARVTAGQRDIDFEYQVLAVDWPRAWAHWTARFTVADTGAEINLDGVFQLIFDENRRCVELREWWHVKAEPPPGAENTED